MESSLTEEKVAKGKMGGRPSEHNPGKLHKGSSICLSGLKQLVQNRDGVKGPSEWKDWDEKRTQK